MNNPPELPPNHEPRVETIELLCDRLADLGLAIGPATARDLLRAIFLSEAPRLDAHLREALETSLETIRIATQSALGVLSAASAADEVPPPLSVNRVTAQSVPTPPAPPTPASPSALGPAKPPSEPAPAPAFGSRRPVARRGPVKAETDELPSTPPRRSDRDDDNTGRPVFKRPRGR